MASATVTNEMSLKRYSRGFKLNKSSVIRKLSSSSSSSISRINFETLPVSCGGRRRIGGGAVLVRCEAASEVGVVEETEKLKQRRSEKLRNGNDSLEICRVVNGMWQTSGGWGKIDRDNAVQAMVDYVDSGLTTFDMADHCKFSIFS